MDKSFLKIWIVIAVAVFAFAGIFYWQYFSEQKEIEIFDIEMFEKRVSEKRIDEQKFNKENLPRFENFSILEEFNGIPATVDFSSDPDALNFITRITEEVERGPNFAGHYTVVEWGCGTECQSGIVVDVKTGAIYELPWSGYGRDFSINSNLLIINPISIVQNLYRNQSEIPAWVSTEYYKWEDNQFNLIYETSEYVIGKDKTADWKTYRNDEYGFEIKHPSGAKFLPSYEYESEHRYSWGFAYNYNDKLNWSEDFNVMVDDNSEGYSLIEWILKNEICVYKLEEVLNKKVEEIVIAEQKAVKLSYPGGTCPMGASSILIKAYTSYNSKIYVFSIMIDGGKVEKDMIEEERNEIFNQMLSSFRFLE